MISFEIGGFECGTLRDVMRIASQFSRTAEMVLDAEGLHISTVNSHNTAAVWIDIPNKLFKRCCHNIPSEVAELGIDCDKLCRMLSAYEPEDCIEFSVETVNGAWFSKIAGDCGELNTTLVGNRQYRGAPHVTQSNHPTHITCKSEANTIREWVVYDAMAECAVKFECSENIARVGPASQEDVMLLRLNDPIEAKHAPANFSTCIATELLRATVAPECIKEALTIRFGDNAILRISTNVDGCSVEAIIAPRIDA